MNATQLETVEILTNEIRPILAYNDPAVQGAVLADLLSLWLAGHPPPVRDEIMKHHFEMVQQLIGPSEHELFPDGKHPYRAMS